MSDRANLFGARLHAFAVSIFVIAPMWGGLHLWSFVGAFVLSFAVTSVLWGEWDFLTDVFSEATPCEDLRALKHREQGNG